jgi:hypothetical protein
MSGKLCGDSKLASSPKCWYTQHHTKSFHSSEKRRAMAQAASCRPVTAEAGL